MTSHDQPASDHPPAGGSTGRSQDEIMANMNQWLGQGVEHAEGREGIHRIVATVRSVAQRLVMADPESADLDELLVVEDAVREVLHRVEQLPQLPTTPAAAPLPASYLFERSPVTGAANPIAAPLHLRFGDPTTARAIYTEQYEGPAGGVHGGVIAAAFDEILGVAQMASGVAGYTGTLEVRYKRMTPLHTVITYEAGVDRLEGRKLSMWARSHHDDEVLAEATGVFVTSREVTRDGDGGAADDG